MNIEYSNDQDVKIYKAFVLDPTNRKAVSKFCQKFGKPLMEPALKLHERLENSSTASHYNQIYGSEDNKIETKKGTKNNDPKIFKVRITGSYRKFMNNIKDEEGNLMLTKEWEGNYTDIAHIYIIAINNHDYNAV
ncbi:MAG: hypothetical protein J1F38_10920 [Muribaculaceae bacterium]|nr:hypothetical protein [Muribaculaceae bacterium]